MRQAADRAAHFKAILKFTLFSLFLDDPDETETNRSQPLVGLKLFPPPRADTRALHKPQSIASRSLCCNQKALVVQARPLTAAQFLSHCDHPWREVALIWHRVD